MRVLYLLLILVVLGSGCEKYNLKQPAYLNFNWKFHSQSSSQGQASIDRGYFYTTGFSVSGTRVKGSPVQISQTLTSEQKVEFITQSPLGISLDIPMGDYTEFTMKTLVSNSNNPCIRLEGIFYKGAEPVNLVIEWSELDELNFKILNSFALEKKKHYKVYIGFDIAKLFATVPSSLMASPSTYNQNGTPTVIINKDCNVQMFNLITAQIPNALVLTVE